jgi:uncharacterized membrane protein
MLNSFHALKIFTSQLVLFGVSGLVAFLYNVKLGCVLKLKVCFPADNNSPCPAQSTVSWQE